MRVAVLAHALRTAGGRSVGLNVVASLTRLRPDFDLLATVPDDPEYLGLNYSEGSSVVPYRETGRARRLLFDRLELPRIVADFAPDWVLALGNFGLRNPPCRQAILLHKAQLVYPVESRFFESRKERLVNALIRRNLAKSLPKSQVVFCQTEVMQRRFSAAFPEFSGNLGLMPNAVSELVAAPSESVMPPELGRSKRSTKLFVLTRYYPHKNLERIVECFDQNREQLADVACFLTIESGQHPGADALLRQIEVRDLSDAIVNVGPLEQSRLAEFFQHSDALLLPTLLESFSGTYLESMAFGCPILTSDLDFARDLCGDTALYFDPLDATAMREAILALRSDVDLRRRLVDACEPRRREHCQSWDEIVEGCLRLLERE